MRKRWLKGLPLHGMTLKDAGRTGSGAAGPQMGADLGEVQTRPPPRLLLGEGRLCGGLRWAFWKLPA